MIYATYRYCYCILWVIDIHTLNYHTCITSFIGVRQIAGDVWIEYSICILWKRGAINVVEIETLIFVKYNVDKHIKNSARLCLICKINHIKREGKSKMTEEHYVHVLHIYWSHKFCIKWKIRLPKTHKFQATFVRSDNNDIILGSLYFI